MKKIILSLMLLMVVAASTVEAKCYKKYVWDGDGYIYVEDCGGRIYTNHYDDCYPRCDNHRYKVYHYDDRYYRRHHHNDHRRHNCVDYYRDDGHRRKDSGRNKHHVPTVWGDSH